MEAEAFTVGVKLAAEVEHGELAAEEVEVVLVRGDPVIFGGEDADPDSRDAAVGAGHGDSGGVRERLGEHRKPTLDGRAIQRVEPWHVHLKVGAGRVVELRVRRERQAVACNVDEAGDGVVGQLLDFVLVWTRFRGEAPVPARRDRAPGCRTLL